MLILKCINFFLNFIHGCDWQTKKRETQISIQH